jgi:hypothetical protein
MRVFCARILYGIVVMGAIAGFCLGFLAYFVRSYSPGGIGHDGLGRELEPTPFVARFMFGEASTWPGWGYFFLDMVVFWGGVAVLYGLASSLGENLKGKGDSV